MTSFQIAVKPPFRLDLTVWALRRRAVNQIDRWDNATYRRAVFAGDAPVELGITQIGKMERPRLHVSLTGPVSKASHKILRQAVKRMLGLEIDLAPFYRIAAQHAQLNSLAIRFRGMRPPRFPTIFEALVNGIACQQLSLESGLSALNRLVAAHGQAPPSRFETGKAFPRAAELACASIPSLRSLGFSNHKSAAIIEIASAIRRGEFQPDQLGELEDAALLARLDQLRGVGRWTAEYVLLRGYGRLNIFPGDDIGAQNSLKRWLGLRRSLDYDRTNKILRQWRPYCGLIYLHLLLKYLEEREMF